MDIPILTPNQRWECPNCDLKAITHEAKPHTEMHNCPGLKGLIAPMVPEGQKCKVEAKVREDYVGKESLRYDEDGRPIAAVETTREDGNDVAVFAPCATVRMVT